MLQHLETADDVEGAIREGQVHDASHDKPGPRIRGCGHLQRLVSNIAAGKFNTRHRLDHPARDKTLAAAGVEECLRRERHHLRDDLPVKSVDERPLYRIRRRVLAVIARTRGAQFKTHAGFSGPGSSMRSRSLVTSIQYPEHQ